MKFKQIKSIQDIVDDRCEQLKSPSNESNIWHSIGNFLDQFYREESKETKQLMINKEPDFRGCTLSNYETTLIGAVAHQLAIDHDLKTPAWVMKEKYNSLEEPHFSLNTKGDLMIVLHMESPKAFRMRDMYVSENTLSRA